MAGGGREAAPGGGGKGGAAGPEQMIAAMAGQQAAAPGDKGGGQAGPIATHTQGARAGDRQMVGSPAQGRSVSPELLAQLGKLKAAQLARGNPLPGGKGG
jgi:hypothetical protein